ncbi:uncharacterized protein LOC128386191 [Panonychus citri]|uniref:uncharacterized protein LOC128386191 n=1 Tax=Panonychus citri TaxID=50023 RepID=UPI0023081954|nr:uncharacterized protein LOC128386191 [Panonychus citri]
MSSSIFLFIFVLLTCYHSSKGYLLDYPIKSPMGSLSILSSLTDKSTQETWTIKETLIVKPKVHGKIEITHKNYQIQVFYHENDDQIRLVFHDNECYELKYTPNGWSSMIPTVTNPLLNMALLMGPSFYYRIVPQSNRFFADDNVYLRGEEMKNLVLNINKNLRLSFLYPVTLNSFIGVRQPKRLILTGQVPGSSKGQVETLFYDILIRKDCHPILMNPPTLGTGCPRYLELNQPFPKLDTDRYHVNVIETIKESSSSRSIYSEFSVDEKNLITRITKVEQFGSTKLEQSIIVHDLGVKYILSSSDGKCYVVPIDIKESQINDDNLITINPITLDIKDFKYVGQVKLEHRSELVDVWESTELYNNDTKYNKIVTTQFMAKNSNNSDLDWDYLPIAAERKFYKYHLSKYILSESRRRDFFDYDKVNHDENDYRESFQITDCYDSPDDKMYLKLHIESSDLNYTEGLNYAAENIYLVRETIKLLVSTNLKLSYIRITNVDIELESNYIVAHVEIVKAPNIIESMDKTEYKFDRQSFDNYFKVSIRSPTDCLRSQSTRGDIEYVISCMDLDHLCVGVKRNQEFPVSINNTLHGTGSICQVYVNGNDKLRKLVQELSLEQLPTRFSQLIGINFEIPCDDCFIQFGFKITNVVQDSPPLDTQETRVLFKDVENGAKIDPSIGESIVGIRNFGDCYRACLTSSKGSTCETFSFCASLDDSKQLVECRVSEKTYGSLANSGTVRDNSCNIYGKNNLLDYHKLPSVKFISSGGEKDQRLSVRTVDECAQACVESNENCYSFEICDSRYCSFGGHYTTSKTISDKFCDIYIPKKIHHFVKNNHKTVKSIIHSEVDLTVDQCASLCFSMRQNDDHYNKKDGCNSFNYCPKGESISKCELSIETISASNVNQVLLSDDCSNYQLMETIKQQSTSTSSPKLPKKSRSGIGIIIFFVIIGLTMGLVSPMLVKYIRIGFTRYIYNGGSEPYQNLIND